MPVSHDSAERFNLIAAGYRTSEVHRSSPTLEHLQSVLPPVKSVCDVACGAGHAGLFFAGDAVKIVSVDPAPKMLEQVRVLAAERGADVETVQAFAESIPLPSASFDLVISRLAAHHFTDLGCAFQEMARLARVGGCVAIIDLEGDEDPAIDALNHEIEKLHDPTHVRSYALAQWRRLFLVNSLEILHCESRLRELREGLTIARWCELGHSGEAATRAIQQKLSCASPEVLHALDIAQDNDGEFRIPVRTFLLAGSKPA